MFKRKKLSLKYSSLSCLFVNFCELTALHATKAKKFQTLVHHIEKKIFKYDLEKAETKNFLSDSKSFLCFHAGKDKSAFWLAAVLFYFCNHRERSFSTFSDFFVDFCHEFFRQTEVVFQK